MSDNPSNGDADAKTAMAMVHVLILALIEARVLDGEMLRRLAEDALTSDLDADPAVAAKIVARLNALIQDTYAAQPFNTSVVDPEPPIHGAGPGK